MKKVILLSVFLAAPVFSADEYGREWEPSCNENQSSINSCAGREYNKIDEKLNELYKQKIKSLSGFYRKAFQEAEIAWVAFKTKDCAYQQGPSENRGSMAQYTEFTCMYLHTKRRIEDINKYIACTDNGCPD